MPGPPKSTTVEGRASPSTGTFILPKPDTYSTGTEPPIGGRNREPPVGDSTPRSAAMQTKNPATCTQNNMCIIVHFSMAALGEGNRYTIGTHRRSHRHGHWSNSAGT